MYRSTRTRRRRSDGRSSYLVGLAIYGGLLVLVNVRPSWEAMPFLTSGAAPIIELLNLALILSLIAQAVYVVNDSARLRAAAAYVLSLLYFVVLAETWNAFPFDFGDQVDAWTTVTRMLLAGLSVWAVLRACRAAVRIVRGRTGPRLAASRSSVV